MSVSSGSPVPASEPEQVSAGANASEGSEARTDELRAELAALVQADMDAWRLHNDPAALCGPTMAQLVAANLVAAGFRRVPEDADTVEQVARAMAEGEGYVWRGDEEDESVSHAGVRYFVKLARLAMGALRGGSVSGGGEQP